MNGNLKLAFLKGVGEPFEFTPDMSVTIGRANDSAVHLNDPHVSRRHATLNCIEDKWTLVDNGSRHGTRINGSLLLAQEPCVLAHGDQISISPFVLRVDLGGQAMTLIHVSAADSGSEIQLIAQDELANLAGQRLNVLLDVAAKLQEANDEKTLAFTAVSSLLLGTGFGRAMLLRGHDGTTYEMLATATQDKNKNVETRISSTLLRAAASGKPVRLDKAAGMNMSESMMDEGVTVALCVPIVLGASVEGFLYLDSTGGFKPGADAAAFAQALAQFVGMGLGDIIGAGVGADGFWFFLGDVAGKGMSAGMMMASIQAYLAAELERGSSVLDAMNAVNSYVRRHRSESEFATLMAMRLSADGRVMRMVDAGHAMGAIVRAGAAATLIECNGGPPVGVLDDAFEFSEIQLQPGDRILLFSDGVCEQRNADGDELGMQRVLECVANSRDEHADVECVMNLLRAHAAGAPFADDVSVASVAFGIREEATRA